MQTVNVDLNITVTGRHMEVTDAIRECTMKGPDMVLLDLGLPDGDGAEPDALAALVRAGLPVRGFTAIRTTLEEAYLREARGEGDKP